jgi:hypothetical protein
MNRSIGFMTLAATLLAPLSLIHAETAADPTGHWQGSIHVVLTLSNRSDGTSFGSWASGSATPTAVKIANEGLSVALTSSVVDAAYRGTLNADGTEIPGTFREGSAERLMRRSTRRRVADARCSVVTTRATTPRNDPRVTIAVVATRLLDQRHDGISEFGHEFVGVRVDREMATVDCHEPLGRSSKVPHEFLCGAERCNAVLLALYDYYRNFHIEPGGVCVEPQNVVTESLDRERETLHPLGDLTLLGNWFRSYVPALHLDERKVGLRHYPTPVRRRALEGK